MAVETHVNDGTTLPEGWEQCEQEIINEFFEQRVPAALKENPVHGSGLTPKSCSASDCLDYARALMQGSPIALVSNQGCNSYTLICLERDRIIQFRAAELNIRALDEAKQIYGDLVASTIHHHDFVLPVYTYNILPGQLHVWQKVPRAAFPLERERSTTVDMANFIATASHFPHSQDLFEDSSWTKSAYTALQCLKRNASLRQIAPEIYTEIEGLSTRLHLLDTLPAVLTHMDLAGQNVFVDKFTGTITGVIDFAEARTEAFGINIFAFYENHVGSMEDGHWSPYDMPAGEQHLGLSVCEVLEKAFWDTLWANTASNLKKNDFSTAVGVALGVGIINRYFVRGMLDEIDLAKRVHVVSLNYATGILLHLRDNGQ